MVTVCDLCNCNVKLELCFNDLMFCFSNSCHQYKMSPREDAPADRGFFVGIIFFILGLGTLLPWNFFMTASMYFNNRLNTSEWSNGTVTTRKEYYFNNWMTLLSQLPLLLFTLLNSFLYHWISEKMRIAGSLVFILLLFILTAVLVKIPMEEDRFFSVTMATIWFINSLMHEFARFYLDRKSKSCELETSNRLLPTGDVEGSEKTSDLSVGSVPNGNPNKGDSGVSEEEGVRQAFIPLQSENTSTQKSSILEVFKKIWLMAFCVTFVFTVTLSVFPAVTVDVKTGYGGKWERYFIPVFCFLLFNVMDFTGRSVTLAFKWPSKDSRLFPGLVVCRVIFVPLLMMCNVQERHYMPVLFSNDFMFAAIMVFFSVSSGYFVCLSMTYAPQLVEPKDGETAGALMTFFLALGLSLGAALSFPLRLLV
ncbi:equilibrative nucleoside transporter 2-like [Sinocyclocheilus anshuiensis]|uniref:equilibrative nucleoside transporter 2-like n=1 Tax=Sinocyclocheilus anshuiensis TaxID=1608454 RepID=UPI0007B816B0|nr:PREDICTED: equilibrative nucleoside transporter 2-like [Sinocyclocheilus anshuiensis]